MSADGSTVYAAGDAPDDNTHNNVYCYNTKTNQWTVLPQPGHRFGILHILDDRLNIFGGYDFGNKTLNKVTTYSSSTNSWYNYYPDMLNKRYRPGIVTYNDYVIVMGGDNNQKDTYDSIEVMNYHSDLQWKEVSIHLPFPMWYIKSTISDNNITIIGFVISGGLTKEYHQIAVEEIISSLNQPFSTNGTSAQWKKMASATYFNTATIPDCHPPVNIGGSDAENVSTSDIILYDTKKDLWKKVDMLTSARRHVGIGFLSNKSIIIIGGCTKGGSVEAAEASSLTTVEIGIIVPKPAKILY